MKVLLVDDHLVVLKGLKIYLETNSAIDIVDVATDGREALDKTRLHQPEVVLMDILMPGMDGIEATRSIKEEFPDIKVIILTSSNDKAHIIPAIRAGASGYQLKEADPGVLEETIEAVMEGKRKLHPEVADRLMIHVSTDKDEKSSYDELTKRERVILEHITYGESNKEIAANLFITEKTVKTHVTNILSKMEVHDRTQAAIHALKNGWFES